MRHKHLSWTAAAALALAAGIVCCAAGGGWKTYGLSVVAGLSVSALVARLRRSRRDPNAPDETQQPAAHEAFTRSLERKIDEQLAGINARILDAQYRRKKRDEIEAVIDDALDEFIAIIRANLDVFTVVVFFPANDGGYRLRRFASRCDFINNEALIHPGVGVIGSFIKDGLKQLKLQEIMSDSITLYYYQRDAGIRSLMASPIVADGIERGTVIVDSTEVRHFTDEDHAFLSRIAQLIGQTVLYAYLYNEHRIKYERLAAMSTIEKDFFNHPTIDLILDRIVEIIPFAIACDRLTVSLRGDGSDTAVIRRVWGVQTEDLLEREICLTDRSLIGLLYAKNLCIYRDFAEGRYEIRYFEEEPRNDDFRSFLAFPFGVDRCKGTILLESYKSNAFTDAHRDMLSRLTTSAGLAIEKIAILEKANTLATQDGLTGLKNHRQFQSQLKDEISRANRYGDMVGLILCDIDFFKKINDNYGHPFGDMVLKGVAAHLKESTREVDVAARYGGEEFALILVKANTQQAVEKAQRIREAIAALAFPHSTGDVRVTMSFGVAVYGEHAKDIDSLIKKADKALYRAKQNGRNRVEVF